MRMRRKMWCISVHILGQSGNVRNIEGVHRRTVECDTQHMLRKPLQLEELGLFIS